MNYDSILTKILIKQNRLNLSHYNRLIKSNKLTNIKEYLTYRYKDFTNYKEVIYRMHYGIENIPLCPICGKQTKFNIRSNKCYSTYCSISCANSDPKVYSKQNTTKIIKYGDKINLKRRKETNLCLYGVEEQAQRKEILSKQIETKLNKYNSTNNSYKRWKTIKSDKHKYDQLCKNRSIFMNSKEFKNKQYDTKKHNNSFNTSKPEDESYAILKEYYPDVIIQYKDTRYPFACDFYIPSLDLFIECNYHWTHGGKPYEGTEDDKQIVEKWKAKNTKFYDNAIQTWTVRDVNKRSIAKQNKLNYIEVWNINELRQIVK